MSTLKVFHETFFRDALDYCQIWQWRAKPELRNTYNLTNKIKTTLYLTEDELQKFLAQYVVTAFKDNEKLTVYRNFNLDKTLGNTTVSERLER